MPRPKKSKPIAAAIEAAEHQSVTLPDAFDRMVAGIKPLTPQQVRGEEAVPAVVTDEMLAFDPASFEKPREPTHAAAVKAGPAPAFGVSLDERQGIRIDVEWERRPGQVGPRVLIKFRNDMPPSQEEKAVLQAEGFSYRPDEKAWAAPKSAANLVLAKRAVNKITHDLRGDKGAALLV